MNNTKVNDILNNCLEELEHIQTVLIGLGEEAKPVPYIKKYALIRATGSIEVSFKQIIADKVDEHSHLQVQNFIKRKIRDSSTNPKLEAIERMLNEFDERWFSKFTELLALKEKPKLKEALTKLVSARNEFAHGGNPDIDIAHTIENFKAGTEVIKTLDEAIHYDFDN